MVSRAEALWSKNDLYVGAGCQSPSTQVVRRKAHQAGCSDGAHTLVGAQTGQMSSYCYLEYDNFPDFLADL